MTQNFKSRVPVWLKVTVPADKRWKLAQLNGPTFARVYAQNELPIISGFVIHIATAGAANGCELPPHATGRTLVKIHAMVAYDCRRYHPNMTAEIIVAPQ